MRFVVRSWACVDEGRGLRPVGRRSVRVEARVKGRKPRRRTLERENRRCIVRGRKKHEVLADESDLDCIISVFMAARQPTMPESAAAEISSVIRSCKNWRTLQNA